MQRRSGGEAEEGRSWLPDVEPVKDRTEGAAGQGQAQRKEHRERRGGKGEEGKC